MATLYKKKVKAKLNITIDESLKSACSKYVKRYEISLSSLISALLTDWEKQERTKKAPHPDQGKLV